MRFPWANVALLLLLLTQAATGYFGFTSGTPARAWLLWLHAIGAYAIALVLLWKGAIIWSVARRGVRWRGERAVFLIMLLLLLLVLALGISWTFTGYRTLAGFSLLSLHIYVALPLLALMAWHSWRRRWILQRDEARDRRAFLRGGLLALGGAIAWGILRGWQRERRFTGSYEIGSMGGSFPRVSWINDRPAPIDPESWELELAGLVERPLVLPTSELLARAATTLTATLDCTGGWFTTQVWRGVLLGDLLAEAAPIAAARTVRVQSVTGYWRRFPLEEARSYLLATHVAGAPLSHGHGAPLRLVVPGRRGYDWVKWITRIELESIAAVWQPPLPLQ
jgi:DMSO/TMAO reductase YedYZ molybdopterin-dependent catalytic subunit